MRWVGLYRKHKALVPSSPVPVLLPVVGGAASKPVLLAAEKLLVKSEIVSFMCFVHHSKSLWRLCSPNSFLSFPTWEAQLTHLGVAHLCGGSLDGMGFRGHFQWHACSTAIFVQRGSNGEPPLCSSQLPRPRGLAVIYGPVFPLSF